MNWREEADCTAAVEAGTLKEYGVVDTTTGMCQAVAIARNREGEEAKE